MAQPTIQQADKLREMRKTRGKEDLVVLETTSEPYGLMVVKWFGDTVMAEESTTRYIRPDGTLIIFSRYRGTL